MTDKVVPFSGVSKLPIAPSRVLDAASNAGMTSVVICGFDADGNDYFASSDADAGAVLYHLERARWRLMQTVDEQIAGD